MSCFRWWYHHFIAFHEVVLYAHQYDIANTVFDAISSPGPMKDYKVNVASVMWKLKNWAIR